jgi:hypothetical protein
LPTSTLPLLIVGDVLNYMVKHAMMNHLVQRSYNARLAQEQITTLYANDTLFTIEGEHGLVRNLVRFLQRFSLALDRTFNWSKSAAFWQSTMKTKLMWLDNLQWQ